MFCCAAASMGAVSDAVGILKAVLETHHSTTPTDSDGRLAGWLLLVCKALWWLYQLQL